MKKIIIYFLLIFIFSYSTALSKTSANLQKNLITSNIIQKDMKCDRLIQLLGGIHKVELLWLGDLSENEFQYAIINTKENSSNNIFYLCGNLNNYKTNSDKTLVVLGQRNLINYYFDSMELFTKVFSITSKASRKYIMSTLNLNDFNITENEMSLAMVAGLTKINEKKDSKKITKKKKTVKAKKVEEEEIFKPKNTSKDTIPPSIIIAENITVNNTSYKIEGKVVDQGSKNIYVELDGEIQKAVNGKFSFERFSPVDEKIELVAIDQRGNRSKPKIINIKILREESIVKSLAKLDPAIIKNPISDNKVALIFGIENYKNVPDAKFANLDAEYFSEYARNVFGIRDDNIKLLVNENASLVGSLEALSIWLPGKIRKNQTDLIIFFAGHGLASTDGKELYLLPSDGNADLLARTGLPRTEIFDQITKLKPKSVTIFLDTCYSGVSRDEQMLLASARPIRIEVVEDESIPRNFTIFTATKLKQISSGLDEAKHGIFSYYLMKGLEGNADSNNDKKITNGELLAYLDENVSIKASELGRQQNPSLLGLPNKVLISYR
tara:strand:+ start:101 stop:1759 length:1659 start_codon:yes stop_codon:yes gene_type:complete